VEKWADRNLLEFIEGKCEVLHNPTGTTPCTGTYWGPPSWKADWQRRTWESW